MKTVKPKEDAKAIADKALKVIADQIAAAPKMKVDDAMLKKQTEAKEKAEKAATDLKLAQEAVTRGEAAITDTANEIKLVTENEKKAKQTVLDAKARLEVVKKESEKAAAERDLATKALAASMKKAKALQFSPNGLEMIATFDTGPQLAWSTVNGKPIAPGSSTTTWVLERSFGTGDGKSLITDRANSLAFSPDGKTLAIGSGEPSRSGDITLWDVATGTLTKDLCRASSRQHLRARFFPRWQAPRLRRSRQGRAHHRFEHRQSREGLRRPHASCARRFVAC
jgi:hypothetical protein